MANSSATGGYLMPADTPAPLYDDELENFFQQIIVGITGIDPTLVRPRWQPEPPNVPDLSVNWIALGIMGTNPDTFAVELHYSAPTSYNELRRHEVVEILTSIYGPNSWSLASILRDGFQIAQNREILNLSNMGLVETGKPLAVPELLKNTWYKRVDMRIWIRRQIKRNYGILDLASAQGTVNNELFIENIDVRNTP